MFLCLCRGLEEKPSFLLMVRSSVLTLESGMLSYVYTRACKSSSRNSAAHSRRASPPSMQDSINWDETVCLATFTEQSFCCQMAFPGHLPSAGTFLGSKGNSLNPHWLHRLGREVSTPRQQGSSFSLYVAVFFKCRRLLKIQLKTRSPFHHLSAPFVSFNKSDFNCWLVSRRVQCLTLLRVIRWKQ